MSGFLLDTHIWLWAVEDSPRLPRGLRRAIDRSGSECWLSPVSVWELGLLVSRGRYELDLPLREWFEESRREFSFREAMLTTEIAVVSHEVDVPGRDPADRFLAATALVYELTLMTADDRLAGLDWLATRSR